MFGWTNLKNDLLPTPIKTECLSCNHGACISKFPFLVLKISKKIIHLSFPVPAVLHLHAKMG